MIRRSLAILLLRTRHGILSRIRVAAYRSLGMTIGRSCRLEKIRIRRPNQIRLGKFNSMSEGTWLWPIDDGFDGVRIDIGDYNYFNRDVMIDACGLITIGSNTMIGPGSYITDSNHTIEPGKLVGECPMDVGRVRIGNGCWIGANVTILKNVVLGDGCIVAAGSIVTQSFDSRCVIGGNPARLIRRQ